MQGNELSIECFKLAQDMRWMLGNELLYDGNIERTLTGMIRTVIDSLENYEGHEDKTHYPKLAKRLKRIIWEDRSQG